MASTSSSSSTITETTLKQRRRHPGRPIFNYKLNGASASASDAAVTVAGDSDGAPFLGTPFAASSQSQPFDYPFPINSFPPDPLLGPQKPPSALPIASSLISAPSLVQQPSPTSPSDLLASLPSVMSSIASSRRSERQVLKPSRSNSSLVSARSTKSTKSLQSFLSLSLSQGSQGSSSSSSSPSPSTHNSFSISPSKPPSLSSRNSSPNGSHRRMTLAIAPSLELRSVVLPPQRPKSLTLSTIHASKSSANSGSSGSYHSSGIGSLSSRSITSIVDDNRIPPTLRSKLQRTGALVVASHDATPPLKVCDRPTQSPTLRPALRPLSKRPLPVRAYSHASSFSRAAPGPLQELEESVGGCTPPSPSESTRISRQNSMKRVIKKTASLVELGLEGLKRATSGRSSASSKRSRTRAGSRTQDTTEASGDSSSGNRIVMIAPLDAPNVIKEEGHTSQNLKHEI